jgi:hypothetical protein
VEIFDLRNRMFDKLTSLEGATLLPRVWSYIESYGKIDHEIQHLDKNQMKVIDQRRQNHRAEKGELYPRKVVKKELLD